MRCTLSVGGAGGNRLQEKPYSQEQTAQAAAVVFVAAPHFTKTVPYDLI
jgi:hypothetical protein